MSKTIAVFGAGPALGLSIARKFGREGFRVALVARNEEKLAKYVQELAGEGIEAAGFAADLADAERTDAVLAAITGRFGPIDVLEYGPGGLSSGLPAMPVLDVGPEHLQATLDMVLLGPVRLVRQVLPAMLERGDGALLITQGASAKFPLAFMANVSAAMAAMRHYVFMLHQELAAQGVYAGTLTIGGTIEGSELAKYLKSQEEAGTPMAQRVESFAPADLADTYWDMYTKRDRPEEFVGDFGG